MTASTPVRPPAFGNARLCYADTLLRDPSILPAGASARTCTWLMRLAIERVLDEFWERHLPALGKASRRAQALVFTRRVDSDIGRRYHQLWSELSRAAHHHAYELTPTAAELRMWHREAVALAVAIVRMPPSGPAPALRSGRPA